MKKINKTISMILALSICFSAASVTIAFADKQSTKDTANVKQKPTEYYCNNLTYIINDDNTVTITNCEKWISWANLDKLNGMKITAIGDNAFKDCTSLKTVTLGRYITSIGENAFENTAIETISLPEGLKSIGERAFGECASLKAIQGYTYRGEGTKIATNAFDGCGELTFYTSRFSSYHNYARFMNYKSELDEEYRKIRPADKCTMVKKYGYNGRVKYIKTAPKGVDGSYTVQESEDGYYFERSDFYVSRQDYVAMCNCVANEYGANYVDVWEMANVAEVIFNVYEWGYDSLYDTIAYPNRFEGSESYIDLDDFSYKVNDRVIEAVNIYLSYPEYYQEGYTSFRGDGIWNYFGY